jgi:hypothetical protein
VNKNSFGIQRPGARLKPIAAFVQMYKDARAKNFSHKEIFMVNRHVRQQNDRIREQERKLCQLEEKAAMVARGEKVPGWCDADKEQLNQLRQERMALCVLTMEEKLTKDIRKLLDGQLFLNPLFSVKYRPDQFVDFGTFYFCFSCDTLGDDKALVYFMHKTILSPREPWVQSGGRNYREVPKVLEQALNNVPLRCFDIYEDEEYFYFVCERTRNREFSSLANTFRRLTVNAR